MSSVTKLAKANAMTVRKKVHKAKNNALLTRQTEKQIISNKRPSRDYSETKVKWSYELNEKHYSKGNNSSKNPIPRQEIFKPVNHVKCEGQVTLQQLLFVQFSN